MKVIENTRGTSSLASALSLIDDVIMWNPKIKNPYDMVDNLKPDLIICHYNETLFKALDKYPDTKIVILGLTSEIEEITREHLCLVPKLPETIKKNIAENYLEINRVANICQWVGGSYNKKYDTDLLYIADGPEYPVLLEKLCYDLKYKIKVVGNRIPLSQYVGNDNIKNLNDMLKSTKIVIDHKGNIDYDAAFNKVFCLSSSDDSIYPKLTLEHVDEFLSGEKTKAINNIIKKSQKFIIKNELTSIHLVAKILDAIDMKNEKDRLLNHLEQIYGKAGINS